MYLSHIPIRQAQLTTAQRATAPGRAFNVADFSPQISDIVRNSTIPDFSNEIKRVWRDGWANETFGGVDYRKDFKRINIKKKSFIKLWNVLRRLIDDNISNREVLQMIKKANFNDVIALKLSPEEIAARSNRYMQLLYLLRTAREEYINVVRTEVQKLDTGFNFGHNLQILVNPMGPQNVKRMQMVRILLAFSFDDIGQFEEYSRLFRTFLARLDVEATRINASYATWSVQFYIYSIPFANYGAIDPVVLSYRSALAVSPKFFEAVDVTAWLRSLTTWIERVAGRLDFDTFDVNEVDWDVDSYPRAEALFDMIVNLSSNPDPTKSYVILASIISSIDLNVVGGGPPNVDLQDTEEDFGTPEHELLPERVQERQVELGIRPSRERIRDAEGDILERLVRIQTAPPPAPVPGQPELRRSQRTRKIPARYLR